MSQANNPQIKAFTDAANAVLDQIEPTVTNIETDVKGLKEDLEAIQNSPNPLSAEDQASLDSALSRLSNLSTQLKTLSDLTPDKVSGGGSGGNTPPVI